MRALALALTFAVAIVPAADAPAIDIRLRQDGGA